MSSTFLVQTTLSLLNVSPRKRSLGRRINNTSRRGSLYFSPVRPPPASTEPKRIPSPASKLVLESTRPSKDPSGTWVFPLEFVTSQSSPGGVPLRYREKKPFRVKTMTHAALCLSFSLFPRERSVHVLLPLFLPPRTVCHDR